MNILKDINFQVFIDGVQTGNAGRWDHAPLMVTSRWEAGGDGEKYDVLSAIRQTYNPNDQSNIRGNEKQTPSQIGRSEGFKALSYSRTSSAASPVVIVSPLKAYHRVVPQ